MQSLTLSAQSDGIGFASTKRSNQGFSNAATRLNTTTAETTTATSASLNNADSLNAVFAPAKFTPPPPPHFQLVSKLTKLITIAFVSLFLIGCGGGGGGGSSSKGGGEGGETEYEKEEDGVKYEVQFEEKGGNLQFNRSIKKRGATSFNFDVDDVVSKFPPFSDNGLDVKLKYARKYYEDISDGDFSEIEGLLTGFSDDGKSGYDCNLYKLVGSLLACVNHDDEDEKAEIILAYTNGSSYPTEAEFATHFGVISAKLPSSKLDEVKLAIQVTNNSAAQNAKSSYEDA
ncbi:MAG: hypothetical protein LBO72_03660, partial [Helicobacteraceae bacterium]|nr:hypothetical protein [Helicobacteraceae bacterium]